jgi:uncharacterized repeat protein (TIGR03803 family)
MVFDSEGNLYGTTQYGGGQADGGAVYSLSPPANGDGAWTEIILHAFTGSNGDGATPIFGLTWGKWHELYGEATEGGTGCEGSGGCGMVFELQP